MINSNIFNYINVLDKAADAAYTRNDILANNIANDSTPNYKRQDVQFESLLQASLAGGGNWMIKLSNSIRILGIWRGLYIQIIHLFRIDWMEIMWILIRKRLIWRKIKSGIRL